MIWSDMRTSFTEITTCRESRKSARTCKMNALAGSPTLAQGISLHVITLALIGFDSVGTRSVAEKTPEQRRLSLGTLRPANKWRAFLNLRETFGIASAISLVGDEPCDFNKPNDASRA